LINNNDKTKLSSLPIDEFWHTVSKLKDYSDTYQYQDISRLAKICLGLPHSNAEAERIFSVVTDVKIKKRNRLGDDTLNSVAVIRSATGAKEINCLNFEVTEKHLKLHNSNNLYKQ
ncbi:protein FAM200B-like, partial [Aphis craccivora]